jgi:hypothetical protein
MERTADKDLLKRLLNSALAADSVMPLEFRRVEDLTPEERERNERWLRFWRQLRQRRSAVLVSTGGKSKDEIVRDVALQLRRAGMLKEK